MKTAYYDERDVYCEDCAPDSAEYFGRPEVDTPLNCSVCHTPLDCDLTRDGINYVIDAIRAEVQKGSQEYLEVHPCYEGTWYEDLPHFEIVADWFEHIKFEREYTFIGSRTPKSIALCERIIQWMRFQAEHKGFVKVQGSLSN